jgi:DNA-binding MarR family transcriptional regulator
VQAEAHREAAAGAWRTLFQLFFDGVGQRRFHEACDASGLAPGVMKTLLQLEPGRPQTMRDLAGVFRCDPSYVTSLVDGLEEAGLAERQQDPADRRVRVVVVTKRGLEAQAAIRKVLFEPPDSLTALTTSELDELRVLLEKLLGDSQQEAEALQKRELGKI